MSELTQIISTVGFPIFAMRVNALFLACLKLKQ